jgi:hypothetical protein
MCVVEGVMGHVHTGRRGCFKQVSELHDDNERHVTIQKHHVHNIRYSLATQDTTLPT